MLAVSCGRQTIDSRVRKPEELKAPVSPQLLMHILESGSFTEDDLIQHYLAGLLVSSRTGIPDDNRSSVLSLLVQNMSVYQIRLHYLFYYLFRKNNLGSNANLGFIENRAKLQTYIPMKPIFRHVFLKDEERQESASLIEHAIYGLNRHNLIESSFFYGSPQHIESLGRRPVPDHGVVMQTSILGIELFMWVNDQGNKSHSSNYLSRDVEIPELMEITSEDQGFTYP